MKNHMLLVATMGCTKLGDVDTYVVSMPTVSVGEHQWNERWVVAGCGSHDPVDIELKEDGKGNADWTIRQCDAAASTSGEETIL